MKIIFYFCSVLNLINAINSEILSIKNDHFNKLNNGGTILDSIVLVQNEISGTDKDFVEVSCVKFYNLQSNSVNHSALLSFYSLYNEVNNCSHYITKQNRASLAPLKFCPLSGTINKATIFLKLPIEADSALKMFAVVNGCYNFNKYGTKIEAFWILSEGSLDKSLYFIDNNMYNFNQIVTDDIYFDGFNRDCSKLCEEHSSPSTKHKTLILIEIIINRVLIVCAIIACLLSTLI